MKIRSALANLFAMLVAFAGLGAPVLAQTSAPLGPLQSPLWLRYPAISPDGQQIAFAFEGSVFVVPAGGGNARLLVGNGHHSSNPVWSPDGRNIAYASDVYGNLDVFIVAADGGPSRRLTTHSANETPLSFTPDGKEVLFRAHRQDARTNLLFPSSATGELYKVSTEGGRRPLQLLTTPAMAARFNRAGSQMLYEDWKGYESDWRKHHVSPVARDVWLYDVAGNRHRQLTSFGGEDRDPVWSDDEKSMYYLSEKSGSFNVWKMPLDNPAAAAQVTRFEKNPVRFLSIAANGMLAFGYDGEIYTLAPGAAAPAKVAVRVAADLRASSVETIRTNRGATEIAPNPDGQEIAFVLRGEIFVASTEFGDTRRITHSPALERSVSFSPDGRRLLFASERDGSWGLYEASLPGSPKDAPYFFSAAGVQIKTLLKNGHENFQPRYSPDGKEVAYLEDRVTLKVLNLASGQSRVVLPGRYNYSYSDGDQWFDWSPDGRSLLVTFIDSNRWSQEVGLVDAAGKGPLVNLSKSGYEDEAPLWTRGGQSMLWMSDRMGLHGQSGSGQKDVFAMFFTRDAFDRFNLSKSEYALLKKQEDEDKKAVDEKKQEGKSGADKRDSAAKEADKKDTSVAAAREKAGLKDVPIKLPPPVVIEFDNLENRSARLTVNSADIRAAAMTPDGETLFFVTRVADGYEVWVEWLRSKEVKKFAALPMGHAGREDAESVDLRLDAKGEAGFVLAGGAIQKFKVPKDEKGEVKAEPVAFNAEMRIDRAAERAEMFEHVWRQTSEKLYVKDMNGVDWAGYRKIYEKFLPFVADNADFAEVLSEMLGELNVSHTGSGYRPRPTTGDSTASLGIFVDPAYTGAGLKIAEIVEGGPLSNAKSQARAGMIIEKIDGTVIAPGMEYDSLLDQKAGKRIDLELLDPATGKRYSEVAKPVSRGEEGELLYKRWVKTEREMVDRLSGGQLGYVHVRGMDDASYRDTYAEILGRESGKKALIVDTRFNGGGNLHDDLATLLGGKRYLEFLPRGQHMGWDPSNKWTKPSLVVISESNYSDAHLFPWVYRKLGIGKLLGMPVAGTGTAVWWETLQDDTLYFGIPQVGFRDEQGNFMEKTLIEPDYLVPNDPALIAAGRDQQIEAAVKVLLQQP
jgi:Tol biopolymer transport system component/C-terminal processing protease CtpA/Prc